MEKTKIGISIGLLGAALYFIAIINIVPLVVIAGYVLLFEENAWLKRVAVKAVCVVIFFAIFTALINLVSNSYNLIVDISALFGDSINIAQFHRVMNILRTVISVVQVIVLLMLGFSALKQGNVKFGPVDNTINKHM